MNYPAIFTTIFTGIGAGAIGSLITILLKHRLSLDREKLAEERRTIQKRREACTAVSEILGEWIKCKYSKEYTNGDRWRLQTTYWRNILTLDKRLIDLLTPRLANDPQAADVREIIVEARRIVLDLKERDLKPTELNSWSPEP